MKGYDRFMLNAVFLMIDIHSDVRTEGALIKKIAEGDKNALHELYDKIGKNVYGFALSITKNTYDAEDILQETFITIYQNAPSYQHQGKPRAWIYTIARNHALMKIRSEKKGTDELNENISDEHFGISKIENADLRLTLETALEKLGDEERQILILHAVSGLKHREIAGVLELPLNTVISKYNRAVKKMKLLLE